MSGDNGIWLKDGAQQYTGKELEGDSEEDDDDSAVEIESDDEEEEEEEENKPLFRAGNLFGVLSVDD